MRYLPLLLILGSLAGAESPTVSDVKALDQRIKSMRAQQDQLDKDMQKAENDFCRSWLSKADLSPVPEPKLAADPTVSQAKAAELIRALNHALVDLKDFRDGLKTGAVQGYAPVVHFLHSDLVETYDQVKHRTK